MTDKAEGPKKRKRNRYDQARNAKATELIGIPWAVCNVCGGTPSGSGKAAEKQWKRVFNCTACDGVGHREVPVDMEAFDRTDRGSDARIVLLSKRESSGLDLWSGSFCVAAFLGADLEL